MTLVEKGQAGNTRVNSQILYTREYATLNNEAWAAAAWAAVFLYSTVQCSTWYSSTAAVVQYSTVQY